MLAGIAALIATASGAFGEIQSALNAIWKAGPDDGHPPDPGAGGKPRPRRDNLRRSRIADRTAIVGILHRPNFPVRSGIDESICQYPREHA